MPDTLVEVTAQEVLEWFNNINTVRRNILLTDLSIPTNVLQGNVITANDFISLKNNINNTATNDPLPPPVIAPALNYDTGEVANGRAILESTRTKILNSVNGWLYYSRTVGGTRKTDGYSQGNSYSTRYSDSYSKTTHSVVVDSRTCQNGYSQYDSYSGNHILTPLPETNSKGNSRVVNSNGYSQSDSYSSYYSDSYSQSSNQNGYNVSNSVTVANEGEDD